MARKPSQNHVRMNFSEEDRELLEEVVAMYNEWARSCGLDELAEDGDLPGTKAFGRHVVGLAVDAWRLRTPTALVSGEAAAQALTLPELIARYTGSRSIGLAINPEQSAEVRRELAIIRASASVIRGRFPQQPILRRKEFLDHYCDSNGFAGAVMVRKARKLAPWILMFDLVEAGELDLQTVLEFQGRGIPPEFFTVVLVHAHAIAYLHKELTLYGP